MWLIESTGLNKINVSAVNAKNTSSPPGFPRDSPSFTAKSPPTGDYLALMVTDPERSSPGSKMLLVIMGSKICSFTQMGLPASAQTL